jgi:hypothetical protein
MAKKDGKKITVALGVKVSRGQEEKMRHKKGSSSAGKYKTVAPKDFAGAAGGGSQYSFPINTMARARNALARAHYASNPSGIRQAVYRKYPTLKKHKEERGHKDERKNEDKKVHHRDKKSSHKKTPRKQHAHIV